VGIPLPDIARKIVSAGKSPTDVANFIVTQEGNDLFINV
jgi:hypothetical protein